MMTSDNLTREEMLAIQQLLMDQLAVSHYMYHGINVSELLGRIESVLEDKTTFYTLSSEPNYE
jgi:hypothetical protein